MVSASARRGVVSASVRRGVVSASVGSQPYSEQAQFFFFAAHTVSVLRGVVSASVR